MGFAQPPSLSSPQIFATDSYILHRVKKSQFLKLDFLVCTLTNIKIVLFFSSAAKKLHKSKARKLPLQRQAHQPSTAQWSTKVQS